MKFHCPKTAWRPHLPLIVLIAGFNILNLLHLPNSEFPGDATAVRIESEQLARTGKLGVPEEIARGFGEWGQYFFYNEKKDIFYPKYGIFNTFAYLPVFVTMQWFSEQDADLQARLRLGLLNTWQVLVSNLTVFLFFLLCRKFTVESWSCAACVFAAIFTSFFWHYLRAHSFEVWQVTLLVGAVYLAVDWRRKVGVSMTGFLAPKLVLCAFLLTCLMLSKAVFILLMPLFFLYLCHGSRASEFVARNKQFLGSFVPICGGGGLLLLWTNYWKFGSPLSTGYTQWEREGNLFSGNLLDGILGYLFDTQFGIFSSFPLLLVAIFYWRDFWKKYTRESNFFFALAIAVLVPHAMFVNWRGEWGYGPRYLLLVLPLLSIPAVSFFSTFKSRTWMNLSALPILAAIVLLTIGFQLQMAVNRFPFFTFYHLYYSTSTEPEMNLHREFLRHPYGRILLEYEKELLEKSDSR